MKRLLVVFLATFAIGSTTAAVEAKDANSWPGATIDHMSCGQVDVTLTAQNGPWGYKIVQDGSTVLEQDTSPSPASGTKQLSIGVRATDNAEHAITATIGNAANMNDGKVTKTIYFAKCGPTPGTPGAKGDKGDKGDAGTPGVKGDKGDKGDTGPAGLSVKGDKGDKGDAGTPGVKGDKGDRGRRGPRGPIGPRGPEGPDGKCTCAPAAKVKYPGTT